MDSALNVSLNGTFQKHSSAGRLTQGNYPTNLLNVLHTPNIKSGFRSSNLNSNVCPTPSSILKVRQVGADKKMESLRFDLDQDESFLSTKAQSKEDSKSDLESNISAEVDPITRPDHTNMQEQDMSVEGSQTTEDEFVFSTSDEIRMTNDGSQEPTDLTPTKVAAYVFSPPLTRSRKKKVTSTNKIKNDKPVKMETSFDESYNTAPTTTTVITTSTTTPGKVDEEKPTVAGEKKSARKTPKRSTKASSTVASVETPSYSTRSRK